VARYLQTEEFDIVHTHSTEAGIIGRFAAALVDAPAVVHTVHGVPFTSDRPPTLNRFVLSCERRAATVTDRLITNADAITTAYLGRNIGRREQYRTVYSGIDINRFRDAEPATDIDGSGVRVLCVARLVEGKGIEDLLAAVNRTDDQTLSVYLVGDGPHRSEIEREIPRRDLSQRVHVLGYRDDIPELMAACDLFVLPSYREGTPRVITEAMASGLPVIATDIAGIPEQIEEGTNGFLIQPGNIPALVDRLDRLAAAPSIRESFGAAGQQRAERFSRERMCADLADVYADVLSNR
jgi:glycosyltransferase involved in cell wall biosynthesis